MTKAEPMHKYNAKNIAFIMNPERAKSNGRPRPGQHCCRQTISIPVAHCSAHELYRRRGEQTFAAQGRTGQQRATLVRPVWLAAKPAQSIARAGYIPPKVETRGTKIKGPKTHDTKEKRKKRIHAKKGGEVIEILQCERQCLSVAAGLKVTLVTLVAMKLKSRNLTRKLMPSGERI